VELVRLSESIRKTTPPGTSVECFRDPLYVYQYMGSNHADVLYAVANMQRLSGFDIARQLRKQSPNLRVFFIWTDDGYKADAFRMGAEGYLIKPVTPEKLTASEACPECGER
jgi:DNA-binding LytR/AlgR family response regulator